jgi:hypothetical protein
MFTIWANKSKQIKLIGPSKITGLRSQIANLQTKI